MTTGSIPQPPVVAAEPVPTGTLRAYRLGSGLVVVRTAAPGRHQRPLKAGWRFSRKAATPSR